MSSAPRFGWAIPLAWVFLGNQPGANAASFEQPRLTQVVKDVRVGRPPLPSVAASAKAVMPNGEASLSTGADSRAEITFRDRTVARLGDNSVLALQPGKRTLLLESGAMLAEVPPRVGATRLKAAHITASVTGTTVLLEYHPKAYVKFIVLDGTARLCLKKPHHFNDCVLLRSGQMLIASPEANGLPNAVDVDLDRLIRTCHLITDFPQLPGHDSLAKAVTDQRERKSNGTYVDSNLVIFGRGTLVTLTKPVATPTATARPALSPLASGRERPPPSP
jgi:FecR protein